MKFTIGVLIAVLPALSFAQDLEHSKAATTISISFEDLGRLVSEKNENIKASKVMVDSSKARTGHLTRSFFPQVSASLGQETFQATSLDRQNENFWKVGAQVNLYRGGRDKAEESARLGQYELSKIEASRDSAMELKKARDAFWDIVAQSKLLKFRQDELKQNEENIRAAGRRAGAGVATNADKLQFELYKAELEQTIENLKLELDFAKSKLAVVLGIEDHAGLEVKGDFPVITKALPTGLARESRIGVKALQAHERIEKSRADVAGKWWQPSVDVYAGYGVPALDDEYERSIRHDRETVAGVRLSFDLGQGLRDSADAKSKGLEAKAIGYKLAYASRELEADEHELEHHMLKAFELISQAERNLEKSKAYMNMTRTEFQRGIKNGPDLQSASRQYFELNERKVLMTRQYLEHQSAFAVLNAQMGTP